MLWNGVSLVTFQAPSQRTLGLTTASYFEWEQAIMFDVKLNLKCVPVSEVMDKHNKFSSEYHRKYHSSQLNELKAAERLGYETQWLI